MKLRTVHPRKPQRALRVLAVLVGPLALACCAESSQDEAGTSGRSLRFGAALKDQNPDPEILEVQLVAAVGKQRYLPEGEATVWGYRDGSVRDSRVAVPGPAIDAQQGQRVIVHFRNELPEATTIHWHGLPVENASDGTPSVQAGVEPGSTFDYEFVAGTAGTFWYHPHLHSDVQIERGLYAPVVVRSSTALDVDEDRTIVLDDVKLVADGTLSEDTTQLDVMLGRQGNVLLANGVRAGRMTAKSGARELWRFVNAANGRYFNLRLPGHEFTVIAWDGGLLAEPYSTETLLIVPGERYEVLVDLHAAPGTELPLQNVYYDRGHDIPDPGPQRVLDLEIEGKASQHAALPEEWGSPVDLEPTEETRERAIELSEAMPAGEDFAVFRINAEQFPDVPVLEARVGDLEIWRVYNNSEMDHPLHLHGVFFRVLDVDDAPPDHVGWKDTVNIPRMQTLRFAVRYSKPGTWMYHCHILEHAERGMMAELKLLPKAEANQP